MADYVLSRLADRDLGDIYDYTDDQFGERQADLYSAALLDRLAQLASTPELGRVVSVETATYRRLEHREHSIFYRIVHGRVRIIRILHRRMLPERHL